jgi:tetratricopeptide (TPR) repeat protein
VSKADIIARRARVQERAGRYTTALGSVTRARDVLAASEGLAAERVRVRLDNLTAITRLGQQKPREARRWAVQAAEGARLVDDPETLVQALMAIEFAELYMGLPITGVHTREALEISVEHGYRPRESIARANLGNFAYFAGRWDEAVQWYASSRQAALEGGNAFGAAETDVSLGDILVSQGRADEAEAVLLDAVRVLKASGMAFEALYGELQLARVFLARAQLDAAEDALVAVIADLVARGHRMTALEASLVHAEVATHSGRPADALAILDDAERAAGDEAVSLHARSCLQRASALLSLGRLDECRETVDAGLQVAREQDLPYEQMLLREVRADWAAQVGDLDQRSADRAEALRIRTQLGARA